MSKKNDAVIITWDYKEQMPLDELNRALKTIKGKAVVHQVETDSDQYGIVVCSAKIDFLTAQDIFNAAFEAEEEA